MALIRIGYFDDFKGSNTLLIECDDEGLRSLIDVIRDVARSPEPSMLERRPDVVAYGAVRVSLERSLEDVGLVAAHDRSFIWRRSSEEWRNIAAKLQAMEGVGPGHQYLDGPVDALQIIAAIGEYGEAWWNNHAR